MSSSAPSDTPNKDLTAQEKEDIENAQDEIKKRRGRPPKKRNFQQFNQDVTIEESEKEEDKKMNEKKEEAVEEQKEAPASKDDEREAYEQDREIPDDDEEKQEEQAGSSTSASQKASEGQEEKDLSPPQKKRRTYRKTGMYSKKNKLAGASPTSPPPTTTTTTTSGAITPKTPAKHRGRPSKKELERREQEKQKEQKASNSKQVFEEGEEDEFSDDELQDFTVEEQQYLYHMKPHAISLAKQLFQISKTFINQLFFTTFQTRITQMLNHFYEDKKNKMKAFNHLMKRTSIIWSSYRNQVFNEASSSTSVSEKLHWSPKGIHYLMASKELVDFFYPDAEQQKQFYIERYDLLKKIEKEDQAKMDNLEDDPSTSASSSSKGPEVDLTKSD